MYSGVHIFTVSGQDVLGDGRHGYMAAMRGRTKTLWVDDERGMAKRFPNADMAILAAKAFVDNMKKDLRK